MAAAGQATTGNTQVFSPNSAACVNTYQSALTPNHGRALVSLVATPHIDAQPDKAASASNIPQNRMSIFLKKNDPATAPGPGIPLSSHRRDLRITAPCNSPTNN